MLTLTENAATAVKDLTAQISSDTGGLRISEAPAPDTGYALTLAPSPEKGDSVVETDGARVFVDETTSVTLSDRVLDARVAEDGSIGFALASRA
jgi:iron-sulfur cluster assembly protein